MSSCNKNFFSLPNEIFSLELSAEELAVYAYLLRCENRRTYQCHPSYKTIGRAVGLSANTVRKYVGALADRGLIATENTSVITGAGIKRNGSLRYTILPIQKVVEDFHQQQLAQSLAPVTPCVPGTAQR